MASEDVVVQSIAMTITLAPDDIEKGFPGVVLTEMLLVISYTFSKTGDFWSRLASSYYVICIRPLLCY